MYVWVLRDKGSEWRAVSSLLRDGPRTFYPLVEAVCEPFIAGRETPAKSPVEVMQRLGGRLQLLAESGFVSADLGNLRQMFSARDRIEMLRLLRRAVGSKNHAVVPVVRCSDEPEFVDAACRTALEAETGLCIRVDGLTNADEKARVVSEIVDRSGIPENLIDFVAHAQDLPRLLSHEEIVAMFPIALRARSWTVVAGTFPPSITHLSPDDYEHHLERSDGSCTQTSWSGQRRRDARSTATTRRNRRSTFRHRRFERARRSGTAPARGTSCCADVVATVDRLISLSGTRDT